MLEVTLSIVIPLVFALLVYWLGGRISFKGRSSPGKLKPYACGEDLPPVRRTLDLTRFYIYLVYFMIFDILGVILALALPVHPVYVAFFVAPVAVALLFVALRVEEVGG